MDMIARSAAAPLALRRPGTPGGRAGVITDPDPDLQRRIRCEHARLLVSSMLETVRLAIAMGLGPAPEREARHVRTKAAIARLQAAEAHLARAGEALRGAGAERQD